MSRQLATRFLRAKIPSRAVLACVSAYQVAALRPTFSKSLFERVNLRVQSVFTGSTSMSSLHEPSEKQIARMQSHIDAAYDDFLDKVKHGRGLSDDALEGLVGGRVLTGLRALGDVPLGAAVPSFGKAALEPSRMQREWWPHAGAQGTVYVDERAPVRQIVEHELGLADNARVDARADGPDSLDVSDAYASPGAAPAELKSRGLVDALGGILDASHYAMTLALQSEIDELAAADGIGVEEAAGRIRPRCRRIKNGQDETIVADLELVPFPKALPLWRRIQQYSVSGEHPFVALVPLVFGASSDVVRALGELRHMRSMRAEYQYSHVL